MKLRESINSNNSKIKFYSTIGGYIARPAKYDKRIGSFGRTKFIALLRLARYFEECLITK